MRLLDKFSAPKARKPTFVADDPAISGRSYTAPNIDEPVPLPPPQSGLQSHVVYRATMGRRFGRVAVDLGLLTSNQAKELLSVQKTRGGRLGELAVQSKWITQEQVQQILEAQSLEIHVDARHAGSPLFLTWLGDLARTGANPKILKVSAQDLETVRQAQNLRGVTDEVDMTTLNLARRIFTDSAAMGASDIHVLVRETYAEIQIRLKGDLKVAKNFTMRREEGEALVRAIYTGLATVKQSTYNPLKFQDAQIHGDALPDTQLYGVRIIRGPDYPVEAGCSFMVARLQYGPEVKTSSVTARAMDLSTPLQPEGAFDVAGFTPLQLELCERLVRLPMGIAIVTGPTGSGKTTTLFKLMKYQAQLFPESRQITIEDPPEYPQPWAIQLAANGMDFREMVRMTLRMDPDIILLGEVRAADEAVAALMAAMTGHFVWTTLHVTDAYKSILRLEMLDRERLSRAEICDHEQIVGMVAQRVVPLLCQECSVSLVAAPQALPAYMFTALKSWGDLSAVRVRGSGCARCEGDKITGRRAVGEIVLTDEAFMSDYLIHGILVARRNHRMKKDSDKSMLANAMDLIFSGMVDPLDVHRGVHKIEPKIEGL